MKNALKQNLKELGLSKANKKRKACRNNNKTLHNN